MRGYQHWLTIVMLTLITIAATMEIMLLAQAVIAIITVITAVMRVTITRTVITEGKIFRRGNLVNKSNLLTGRITEGNIRTDLIVSIIPAMQAIMQAVPIIPEILMVQIVRLEKTATKKKITIKEAHIPTRMGHQDTAIHQGILAEQKRKRLLKILKRILPELKKK